MKDWYFTFVIGVAGMAAVCWYFSVMFDVGACQARGGVFVRSSFNYACLEKR